MASPLRVKNTAYFDIAATPPPTDTWIPAGPLVGGYAPTTRPTSEQGDRPLAGEGTTRAGEQASEPGPVLAAKVRFGR
jgi:hypothetical protein